MFETITKIITVIVKVIIVIPFLILHFLFSSVIFEKSFFIVFRNFLLRSLFSFDFCFDEILGGVLSPAASNALGHAPSFCLIKHTSSGEKSLLFGSVPSSFALLLSRFKARCLFSSLFIIKTPIKKAFSVFNKESTTDFCNRNNIEALKAHNDTDTAENRLHFFFVQDCVTAKCGSIPTCGNAAHGNDGCSGFSPDSQLHGTIYPPLNRARTDTSRNRILL